MSASAHVASPVGGKLFTPGYLVILGFAVLGLALMVWRLAVGLGASTGLSDGYPWGVWIAFDVATGTAIGTGGWTLAILIYILNKGQYHPLIRGALVTTALGYTVAGLSILIDVGRWWLVWKIPLYAGRWSSTSALLEVALAEMTFIMVAWVLVSSSMLDGMMQWKNPTIARLATKLSPIVKKLFPFLLAAGLLFPALHQSSLGTLMVLTTFLHPLWHTGLLPLLFLVSALTLGFGGVILESAISMKAFRREAEWPILAQLSRVVAGVAVAFVLLRLGDVFFRGAVAQSSPGYLALFGLELVLFLIPAAVLFSDKRRQPGWLFGAAAMLVFGGALYRFDVTLIAFNPGPEWSYFPSVPELFMTFGMVAMELAAYIAIVKKFPILTGRTVQP